MKYQKMMKTNKNDERMRKHSEKMNKNEEI